MASKRHVRRKMCGHKARHASAENAEIALRRYYQEYPLSRYEPMNIYCCSACGFYHVGHRPVRTPVVHFLR